MKFKAFLFALVLLVGYYFIADFLNRSGNEIVADQGQWSQNSLKAQRFLYDFNPPKYNCIVGTSLALRLVQDSLPSNYYNLCLNGQTVLDGLMVLKHKTKLPDTLFIETNFITRSNNEEFTNKIAGSKGKVLVKKKLSFLQEKYLPIGWVANYLQSRLDLFYLNYVWAILKGKLGLKKSVHVNSSLESVDSKKLFKDVLLLEQDKMNVQVNEYNSAKTIELTQLILKEFEKHSVKLVFFEMPVHCALVESNLMTVNRRLVRSRFSPNVYRYLNLGFCQEFETTDAVHLTTESAIKCTSAFKRSLIFH